MPLFWRVDLDIVARSVHRDAHYDRHNSAARGFAWSATESTLANAVVAVKAHLRRRDDKAIELLRRGYQRVGLDIPDLPLAALLLRLTEDIEAREPATTALAEAVKNLVTEAF